MKLRKPSDKYLLLTELNRLDLIDAKEIPQEIFLEFIKARRGIVPRFKNFRKSQITKRSWRTHRWRYMKGIKKFHRSIAGKRFHRSLGRYLATRFTKSRFKESLDFVQTLALKGLSSLRTHLHIEGGYFMTINERVEFELFADYALPLLQECENLIYNNADHKLDEDQLELLLRLVEEKELLKCVAEMNDIEVEKVQSIWNALKVADKEDETHYMLECFQDLMKSLTTN